MLNLLMKTTRFVFFLVFLVVTTLSIGVVAFLFLKQEGETIRDRAKAARDHAEKARVLREAARDHAEEARKVATGYREMGKYSQQMTVYADQQADYAMALRARTIADNVDLLMRELKDGLMEILQSFPEEGIAKELILWEDKNNFVHKVYLWQGDVCLSLSGQNIPSQTNPKDLPLFNQNQDWIWNEVEHGQSVLVQSDSIPPSRLQQSTDSVSGKTSPNVVEEGKKVSGNSPSSPPPDVQQEEVALNSPTVDVNQEPVDQRSQQNTGSNDQNLSSQLEQQNREIGQQLQSLPENKSWSSSTYLGDNYSKNQKTRLELRNSTQNEVLSNIQKHQGIERNKDNPSMGGWQYLNGSQGRLWGCWLSNKPAVTRGLQIDSKELEGKLKTALPENVDEDEYFVLLDEKGIEVCSVGEMALEGESVSRVEIEVGKGLPGWTVLATRRTLPSFTLPEIDLPEIDPTVEGNDEFSVEADDTSLAGLGEGWGGYIVVSSVMAAILVGSTLLGGSVLLLQVRRNSLEAIRKTTFVSNVSHELKTPLTTIRMYGEMLDDGLVKDEKKRRNYLSTIITESQRLTRLVNNVLDFSRLERGEKNYNLKKVELADCLKEALESQRPRLAEKGFTVEWIAKDGDCRIEADSDALEQVLLNLLDNIVKYASDGKWVEVKVESNSDEVAFEVSDHGPGIKTEQRERIFETFHRVDDSLTASQPGCGLGLGISRKLVEDMGGCISCESNQPHGVRFRVSFPKVMES